jgi:hypothetical protein
VVPEANAIGYPWTVVVHAQNARSTDAAMVRAVWLEAIAPLAKTSGTCVLDLVRHWRLSLSDAVTVKPYADFFWPPLRHLVLWKPFWLIGNRAGVCVDRSTETY